MTKPPFNWNAVVRSAIRRAFARSPKVREVMNAGKRKVQHYNKDGTRAKVDRAEFNCQVCNNWVPAKFMSGVDHVIPVVSVEEGFQDWNTYIARIDCDPKNLQRICKKCHDVKSLIERRKRQALKDAIMLDQLEKRVKNHLAHEYKELKKELSKYKSKSKAEETRTRALKLLEGLK